MKIAVTSMNQSPLCLRNNFGGQANRYNIPESPRDSFVKSHTDTVSTQSAQNTKNITFGTERIPRNMLKPLDKFGLEESAIVWLKEKGILTLPNIGSGNAVSFTEQPYQRFKPISVMNKEIPIL